MTRRDYVLLAAALRDAIASEKQHEHTGKAAVMVAAGSIADALHKDNPNFNRETFYAAITKAA